MSYLSGNKSTINADRIESSTSLDLTLAPTRNIIVQNVPTTTTMIYDVGMDVNGNLVKCNSGSSGIPKDILVDSIHEYTTDHQILISTLGTNNVAIQNTTFKGDAISNPVNSLSITTTGTVRDISLTPSGNLNLNTNGSINLFSPNMTTGNAFNVFVGLNSSNKGAINYSYGGALNNVLTISDDYSESIELSDDLILLTTGQSVFIDSDDDGTQVDPLLKINCASMTSGTTIHETFGKDNTHFSKNDFTYNTAESSTLGILVNGGVIKNGGIIIDETGTKIPAIGSGTIAASSFVGINSSGYLVKSATPSTTSLPIGSITTTNTNYIPYSNGTNETESSNLQFDGTNLIVGSIQKAGTLTLATTANNNNINLQPNGYGAVNVNNTRDVSTTTFGIYMPNINSGAANVVTVGLDNSNSCGHLTYTHSQMIADNRIFDISCGNAKIQCQYNGNVNINTPLVTYSTASASDYYSHNSKHSVTIVDGNASEYTISSGSSDILGASIELFNSAYATTILQSAAYMQCANFVVRSQDGNTQFMKINSSGLTFPSASEGISFTDNSVHLISANNGNVVELNISSGTTLTDGSSIQMHGGSSSVSPSVMNFHGVAYYFLNQAGNSSFLVLDSSGLHPHYTTVNPTHQVVIDDTGLLGVLSKDEEEKRNKLFNTADERITQLEKDNREMRAMIKKLESRLITIEYGEFQNIPDENETKVELKKVKSIHENLDSGYFKK